MWMKLALAILSVLISFSFWFGPQQKPSSDSQEKPPDICRGKSLPIMTIPGPPMTASSMPLRFGGTRTIPVPWVNGFPTEKGFREVIKSSEEFSDFWKRLTAITAKAGKWVPPVPEIDFSKETIVVAAMGARPSTGYGIVIDGACQVEGQVEVNVTSIEQVCGAALMVLTAPADAVRIPRTDLPIVFRESEVGCKEWSERFMGVKKSNQ